ncbi:hypothetical protein CONLIGDRAFT_633679 [Coniochaeta ligniaria NRRL 30616]|uniref:Uncharacterized protein n=1 Tax=Coniochaeta ligniaria NRRL 30616 TaxID=1408157 RepID=A0A1J7JC39_9PEZI|nr:hypothetical protein CONLIGDRAFT_633679 [Coniochaeta ligniaria NRRL 30616]
MQCLLACCFLRALGRTRNPPAATSLSKVLRTSTHRWHLRTTALPGSATSTLPRTPPCSRTISMSTAETQNHPFIALARAALRGPPAYDFQVALALF